MARPKKPDSRKASKLLQCWLSPADFARLEALVAERGLDSRSALIRMLLRTYPTLAEQRGLIGEQPPR